VLLFGRCALRGSIGGGVDGGRFPEGLLLLYVVGELAESLPSRSVSARGLLGLVTTHTLARPPLLGRLRRLLIPLRSCRHVAGSIDLVVVAPGQFRIREIIVVVV